MPHRHHPEIPSDDDLPDDFDPLHQITAEVTRVLTYRYGLYAFNFQSEHPLSRIGAYVYHPSNTEHALILYRFPADVGGWVRHDLAFGYRHRSGLHQRMIGQGIDGINIPSEIATILDRFNAWFVMCPLPECKRKRAEEVSLPRWQTHGFDPREAYPIVRPDWDIVLRPPYRRPRSGGIA